MRLSDYTLAELIQLERKTARQRERSLEDAKRLWEALTMLRTVIRTRSYEAIGTLDQRKAERKRMERLEATRGD